MLLPYSNVKPEATNKLIKDIKRNTFGYRNFDNFKKTYLHRFEQQKSENNNCSRQSLTLPPTTVDKEPLNNTLNP